MSENVTTLREEPLVPMPMPGGREQFWNLLTFLNDKKSFETRMQKLEEATKKHNAAIKTIGGAKNIERRLEEASNMRLKAGELVKSAEAEALKLAENNEAEQSKLNKFSGTLEEIKIKLTTGLDKLADDEKVLDERGVELQKRSEQLDAAKLEAQIVLKQANVLQARFEAKLKEHQIMLNSLQN